MHPDDERLLLACLPGAMAGPPPLDSLQAAPCDGRNGISPALPAIAGGTRPLAYAPGLY